jgi:hypothetical protein
VTAATAGFSVGCEGESRKMKIPPTTASTTAPAAMAATTIILLLPPCGPGTAPGG